MRKRSSIVKVRLQRAGGGESSVLEILCEWTFEGVPKARASRLRRLTTVITYDVCMYIEEANALNSGGTADFFAPSADIAALGLFVLQPF